MICLSVVGILEVLCFVGLVVQKTRETKRTKERFYIQIRDLLGIIWGSIKVFVPCSH